MGTRQVGKYVVETSSEDKVLFPESGVTKGELIDYYDRIGDTMMRYVRGRPITMIRYPEGIGSEGFYQQEAPEYFPEWIERLTVPKEGGEITHAICNHRAALVYLANQNTITPHVWLSRADRMRQPDQLVLDLDPGDNGDFREVRFAARALREILEEHGLVAFVMTTGSKGVHVRAPIRRGPEFEDVRGYARGIAEQLAETYPARLTTEHRKDKRRGRIYLDIFRIAYAQTAVPPYAVRPRPGAPVATPIEWDELGAVTPDKFTIRNVFKRLDEEGDPWRNMFSRSRSLKLQQAQ